MAELKSEMAGVIESILVSPGDEVSEGQKLLVVESMKTLMEVNSPHNGKISDISVEAGDFVDEGDILMVFEQ